ncbi:MAG: adenylate/guanylate cyclase domain-containing protein [Gammaproteobacteria bacterium]|nr:adenylate/guanylate cyclase domain-containing protein [Gammaproteobacteria bacterium]
MMEQTQHNFAVLFADVAGSTSMYEKFGDVRASKLISDVLEIMFEIIARHKGVVIKTIGDEVMCRFPRADNAVESACEIHEALDAHPPCPDVQLAVRIGLHWGSALLQEDGDLLGDAVNVAARMTGIAQERQIITTEEAVSQLTPALREKCREFDRAAVKGKSEEVIIYEMVWEPTDVTRMGSTPSAAAHAPNITPLTIRYHDVQETFTAESPPLLIGRGPLCNLVVQSPLASRNHAIIRYSRGKFIYMDQSTNGTYVHTEHGKRFYLRREILPLSGNGIICLGEPIEEGDKNLLYYSA